MPAESSSYLAIVQSLASALSVGLLIGIERGWRDRSLPEGRRVAGLRTFGLIGLLGGILQFELGARYLFAAGLLAIALLFAVSYPRASKEDGSLSITTAVAALVTYSLGAVAASGQVGPAIAAAVVVALLLDLKPVLHRWLRLIQPAELNALLQLGVLSAVVLPTLPDVGMGPYGALNPFRIWLAVILIASLSLAGHIAVRARGTQQGLMWLGLLGGLASSTAATLALARSARRHPEHAAAAAAAILAACGVMFMRMAVVVTALRPSAGFGLALLLMVLAAVCLLVAAWRWRGSGASTTPSPAMRSGPGVFDLGTAVFFGAALAVVAVVARAGREAFGDVGLYGVAFMSGLADVDAAVIAGLQMAAQGQLTPASLQGTVLLAALANLITKATMAWLVAGRGVGAPVARGYLAVVVVGAAIAGAGFIV